MGWLIILVLALATFGGLWSFVRRDRGALQFLAAALLLALAGYSLQGRPQLAGQPKPPPERQEVAESEFAATRENMLGRFDRAWFWLNLAEGRQQRGDTKAGVDVIRSGLREGPNDADLWVGLGNALVVHADGMMTPAAELAFQRAAQLAPDHPGPRFFYGLALAQGGQFDEAERIWRGLLASAPADASYRPVVEERLQALERARMLGQIPGPPPAP
ncbi:MAG TPA: tetratricopeptide repeat protein [Allosphingosinicella sp.]|nr:tetratricopeptide repeat protein [Allosphingosinicella sp.]